DVAANIEQVMPASPEVVYNEWLNADALAEWMCPRPAKPTRIELDARVDGQFRFDIEEDGAPFFVTGKYLALDPPRRIRFTWSCSTWPNPELESVVTVSLEPHNGDETLMIIDHRLLPPDQLPNHRA